MLAQLELSRELKYKTYTHTHAHTNTLDTVYWATSKATCANFT